MKRRYAIFGVVLTVLGCALPVRAQQSYSFGVVPVRSIRLTAEYWNPILEYVGARSGIKLSLATRKSNQEYSEAEARGEFDFVFNNHIFAPSHAAAGYRVIARPAGKPLHSKIVVPDGSEVRSIGELKDKEVGFPGKNGFSGYAVPMSALITEGIAVKPVFGGNQEGVMEQLRSRAIPAAAVNSLVLEEFATRQKFDYRVLWTSDPLLDIPIAAHPRIAAHVAKAVADALVGMVHDAAGRKILEKSATVIGQKPPLGFVTAKDAEYQSQREIYRIIWKHEGR